MEPPTFLLSIMAAFATCLAAGAASAGDCPGAAAAPGSLVHGPVLQIPDAGTLCVAQGQSRSTWVEIRLARAAATRGLLMAAAFGKNATCIVTSEGYGACLIEATPLTAELERPETIQAAASWR